MRERDEALKLAERILDRPYGDPDDDLAILARQLLRRTEECQQLLVKLKELEDLMKD